MNIKKAISFGALLWVFIFFEISILMFGFNIEEKQLIYTIHYIVAIILISLCALLYFKREKKGALEGLYLGIIFVITGLILDAVITVPLFVKTYTFFLDPYLLVGLAETILITIIIGTAKK